VLASSQQQRANSNNPSMPKLDLKSIEFGESSTPYIIGKIDFAMGELHNSRSRSLNPARSTNVTSGTASDDVVDSALNAFETTTRHKQMPLHKGG
jgi:hypothetical protein